MKKFNYLILVLFFVNILFAQKTKTTISRNEIGTLRCEYGMSIDSEKSDTSKYVFIGFQNAKYTAITDFKAIYFNTKDKENIVEFIDILKKAILELGNKTNLTWDKKNYSIKVYDFTKDLFLTEASEKGEGFTTLSKKHVEKLIQWLESLSI